MARGHIANSQHEMFAFFFFFSRTEYEWDVELLHMMKFLRSHIQAAAPASVEMEETPKWRATCWKKQKTSLAQQSFKL